MYFDDQELISISDKLRDGKDKVRSCCPDRDQVVQAALAVQAILLGDCDKDTIRSAAEQWEQQIDCAVGEPGGGNITVAFIRRLPEIRGILREELQAAVEGDPAAESTAEILASYPGFFAVTIYRLAHVLYQLRLPMIPRLMTEYAHSITGIDIHTGAQIGSSFFIDHGTGVVIGQTAVIGNRVKLYQGVTLGGLSTRGGQSLRQVKRHPTIEDDVTIYANATILGGETVIGKGSVIGANVFITDSVAPGTTVTTKDQQLRYRTRKPDSDGNGWQEK